jgi:N-carbamoylputrescine amidase
MTARPASVRIALIQERAANTQSEAIALLEKRVRAAAASGAQIICTQELFNTPYFCRTQDVRHFDLAEPVPGPTTDAVSRLAAELNVVLIVSLFEHRGPGVYHNTAAVIDADGRFLGKYRKMHIPQDPGFEEKFYFTPGDLGYPVWKTAYGCIGVLICWDQWFPEAARMLALAGAEILFCPTAIGWLADEKETEGATQHSAWEIVQRGHAVANGCYFAAVNRTGKEGNTEFWGQSFVADYHGRMLARASVDQSAVLTADCDLQALEQARRIWPFLRDRRIDSFDGLASRMIDDASAAPEES